MKKIIGQMVCLFIVFLCAFAMADVEINAANFPDDTFREYVKQQFDADGDGVLSDAEIAEAAEIDVEYSAVTDLTGVEHFTSLVTLKCKENELTSLDVSKNTKMTYLDCTTNGIAGLNLSHNTALATLWCTDNALSSLDLSNNTELEYLGCAQNSLTELDLGSNPKLKEVYCDENKLKALDVSSNKGLYVLWCSGNMIKKIDISNNSVLVKLFNENTPEEQEDGSLRWESGSNLLCVDQTTELITEATPELTLDSVKFSKKKAAVKEEITITAVTSTGATKLIMYNGSKEIQSWTKGYTDKDDVRIWKVTCTFAKAGERTMDFRAADKEGNLTDALTAKITITKAAGLTLDSVKFARKKATVKQKVTINAVTSTTATKLIMYDGDKEIQSWTKGYTDKDGKRTWKVTCTFAKAGARTMSFKAADKNGKLTAAKNAKITITKAPTLSKVTLSKDTAKRKEKFTIKAVTSTNVTELTMYLNGKAAESWTEGYTDKNGKRTWKVTYAFAKAGKKTLSFKAFDANGAGTAKKTAEIEITK